jgi:hypothetical protein
MPSSGVQYEHAEMVFNVVKSREGWELHTVTDGIMVALHDIGHHLSMFISDSLMMAF